MDNPDLSEDMGWELFMTEDEEAQHELQVEIENELDHVFPSNDEIAFGPSDPGMAYLPTIAGNSHSNPETPTMKMLDDLDRSFMPRLHRNSMSRPGAGDHGNIVSMPFTPGYTPDGLSQGQPIRYGLDTPDGVSQGQPIHYELDGSTSFSEGQLNHHSFLPIHGIGEVGQMTPSVEHPHVNLPHPQEILDQTKNAEYSPHSTGQNTGSPNLYYLESVEGTLWRPNNSVAASPGHNFGAPELHQHGSIDGAHRRPSESAKAGTDPPRLDFSGVTKEGILSGKLSFDLSFESFREARSMNRVMDTLMPEEDHTFPLTPGKELEYVQRMYDAMLDMDMAEDNAGMQKTWKSMLNDDVKIERTAWEIMVSYRSCVPAGGKIPDTTCCRTCSRIGTSMESFARRAKCAIRSIRLSADLTKLRPE